MKKYCKHCDSCKDTKEFYISSTTEDGIGFYCIECTKEKARNSWNKKELSDEKKKEYSNRASKWRIDNTEKFYAYQVEYRKKNHEQLKEYHKLYQRAYRKKLKENQNGNQTM